MNSVNLQKLGDISSISSGYPFRGRIEETEDSGYFAVQMKDISAHGVINWSGCVETELEGKKDPQWLMPGDILLAARGNRNYAVLITDAMSGIQAVASPQFYVITLNNTAGVMPEFLVWLLNQQPCQRYFDLNAEGTLTKSLRRSFVECAEVAIPSREKQEQIIHLARNVSQQRQLSEQLIRNGEQMLNAVAGDLMNQSSLDKGQHHEQ